MNPNQPEPTFDESVKQVMQTLPPPIRNYLAQEKYTAVAKNLMTKYGLRIDQGGVLEREIMLLLMGVENPDDFTKALVEEARLDQKVISGIVQDVNAQIFVPLRAEMQRGAAAAPQGAKPAAPSTPSPVSNFHLQNKIPIRPAQPPVNILNAAPKSPQQPMMPRPPVSTIAPLPPKMALPQRFSLPTTSIQYPMLPLGEEPQVRPANSSPRPVATPPTNLPGAMPPTSLRPVSPSVPVAPTQPKPVPPPIATPAKPYSSDPYREPLE